MEIYELFHHKYIYNISDTIKNVIKFYNVWNSCQRLALNPVITCTVRVALKVENDFPASLLVTFYIKTRLVFRNVFYNMDLYTDGRK